MHSTQQTERKLLKVGQIRRAKTYDSPFWAFIELLGGFFLPIVICFAIATTTISGLRLIYEYRPIALIAPSVLYALSCIWTLRKSREKEFRMAGFLVNGLAIYTPLFVSSAIAAGPGVEVWDVNTSLNTSLPLFVISFIIVLFYAEWAMNTEYQIYYEKKPDAVVSYE